MTDKISKIFGPELDQKPRPNNVPNICSIQCSYLFVPCSLQATQRQGWSLRLVHSLFSLLVSISNPATIAEHNQPQQIPRFLSFSAISMVIRINEYCTMVLDPIESSPRRDMLSKLQEETSGDINLLTEQSGTGNWCNILVLNNEQVGQKLHSYTSWQVLTVPKLNKKSQQENYSFRRQQAFLIVFLSFFVAIHSPK